MKQTDVYPRYLTVAGCEELACEMDRAAKNARMLMQRHEGWARALRSRATKIAEAECLEAEARAARFKADAVANRQAPVKSNGILDIFPVLR